MCVCVHTFVCKPTTSLDIHADFVSIKFNMTIRLYMCQKKYYLLLCHSFGVLSICHGNLM